MLGEVTVTKPFRLVNAEKRGDQVFRLRRHRRILLLVLFAFAIAFSHSGGGPGALGPRNAAL